MLLTVACRLPRSLANCAECGHSLRGSLMDISGAYTERVSGGGLYHHHPASSVKLGGRAVGTMVLRDVGTIGTATSPCSPTQQAKSNTLRFFGIRGKRG